jgi:phage pi2 protein 07
MGLTITIPKRITHGEELVLLRKDEYERLIRHKKEIVHALRVIAEGEKAYREGRTIKASSLKEALKIYAKRSH